MHIIGRMPYILDDRQRPIQNACLTERCVCVRECNRHNTIHSGFLIEFGFSLCQCSGWRPSGAFESNRIEATKRSDDDNNNNNRPANTHRSTLCLTLAIDHSPLFAHKYVYRSRDRFAHTDTHTCAQSHTHSSWAQWKAKFCGLKINTIHSLGKRTNVNFSNVKLRCIGTCFGISFDLFVSLSLSGCGAKKLSSTGVKKRKNIWICGQHISFDSKSRLVFHCLSRR